MPEKWRQGVARTALMLILISQASCGHDSGESTSAKPRGDIRESDVQAALESAETYMVTSRAPEARAILTVLAERSPEDWRPHEMLGRLHFRQGTDALAAGLNDQAKLYQQQAYASYARACERAPDDENLQQSAGEIAAVAGLAAESLMHFGKAAALKPLNPRASLLYGQQLLAMGQTDAAQAALEHVLMVDPGQPYAHATLALIDAQAGARASAQEHIAAALRRDPQNIGIRLVEAKVYRSLDDPEMIVERLGPLTKAQRANPGVAFELAWAWNKLGRPRPAAEAWINLFNASPTHPDAWQWARDAAIGLNEAGDQVAAQAWQRQAEMLAPRESALEDQ